MSTVGPTTVDPVGLLAIVDPSSARGPDTQRHGRSHVMVWPLYRRRVPSGRVTTGPARRTVGDRARSSKCPSGGPVLSDRLPAEAGATRLVVALACRILARAGLTESVLGHVSARVGP